ncbi:MAG: hypothetical protein QM751_12810 [Paludibacteraceae bacterium]
MNQKKYILITALSIFIISTNAQTAKYSTAWFGPNANPVPEFTDARIPAQTTISLMGDYYFGHGDQTENGYVKIEFPLLPERVSLKLWSTVMENYQVTDALSAARGMNIITDRITKGDKAVEFRDGKTIGTANGDLYVQTRIRLLQEKKKAPAIILNATIKTASGTNFPQRRYFDTPGYYFDVEVGKSFYTKGKFLSEIRAVANTGFLCWETTNSTQDDATMYGGKLIIGNPTWKLENTVSGYWGWIHTNARLNPLGDYGDAPLVYAAKFSIMNKKIDYFAQYQYGIKDFPYHQIRVGISFPVEKLTPKFLK